MKINVQFQLFDESSGRPYDEVLNNERIEASDQSLIPSIGDHIAFMGEESGGEGIFKVRSRLFSYLYNRGEWTLSVNVVVQQDNEKGPELIKE
jgi:hypothetical protein